jgi:hypothetical protein
MRAEVNVARDAAKLDTQLVSQIDERLQLARVTGQPVEMPDEHSANPARAQVIDHPLKLRPLLAAPGADVIIDIHLVDDEPAPHRIQTTIRDLPRNPKLTPSRSDEIRA